MLLLQADMNRRLEDLVRHGSQYLYIGSEGCARNTPMLKRLQITHILSVCHFETDLSSSYEHLIVPINDDFEARLDFEQTATFISQSERILIHCKCSVIRFACRVLSFNDAS